MNHHDSRLTPMESRQTWSKKALLFFFGFMLLLTFFSNTINNFTLPRVKVEYPASGALTKEIQAGGEIIPQASQQEYSALNTTVAAVHVKAGETVEKGQLLMSLDNTEAMVCYREEMLHLRALQLEAQTGNHRLAGKRDEAKQNYELACRQYERCQQLLAAGAESPLNWEKAEAQMNTSAREYHQAQEDYELGLQKAACELQAQELKLASLKRELDTKYQLRSQCDGLVKEVNFRTGSLVNSSKPLLVIVDQSEGYEFKMVIESELAAYLTPGDQFTISLSAKRQSLKGTVARITAAGDGQCEVYADVKADGLAGGESGQAFISKDIGFYDCLVSNSAVGREAANGFVWLVEKRQAAWGSRFYVRKLSVSVINSDHSMTALQKGGLDRELPIVGRVEGNRSLTDGCQVLLAE